jgi:hypothetical protein
VSDTDGRPADEMGGDPPCWADLVDDVRDAAPDDEEAQRTAAPEGHRAPDEPVT